YNGTVKSLTGYGAFVDIGGIDGMVHVSELSWSRIKQPGDVLTVGDKVEVYVINFDKENRKISLGYKDPTGNPWSRFSTAYNVGDVINAKIVKLMPFGAFAEVLPGVDGLIHISQIANRRIGKPDEVLAVGDMVDVKITAIDNDKQKISLSIRALSEPEHKPEAEHENTENTNHHAPAAQGDALVYEVSASGEATGVAPETETEK
ncbi:MAG: S1 RNA-binding domain-containing protein, partial [Oscillospiraceae bacterium]